MLEPGPTGWPAGHVTQDGVPVAGGATAGVGDQVVTRHNDRRLSTGRRWVRNGDTWTVTGIDPDGSMTVRRLQGGSQVVLPAAYVSEHVELGYASTAHRAQGRTVDTAHAMVSPTTTREVLYVMATRGREVNRLYVDTHYDPDPETSHGQTGEPQTARDVLIGALRNEGADVAAHDMMQAPTGRSGGNGTPGGRVPHLGHVPPRQSAGTPCWPAQDSPRRSCSRFVPVRHSVS